MVNSILITVRTSSTRLPRKAIIDINGKPTIQYLIENIKKSRLADKIILCTSEEPDDDILCQIATDCGIDYYRGSLKDKLVRWMEACKEYNIDFFVNVDGADLFLDYNFTSIQFSMLISTILRAGCFIYFLKLQKQLRYLKIS